MLRASRPLLSKKRVETFESAFGKGLRAARRFEAGEILLTERHSRVLPKPTRFTLQRAPSEHLECRSDLRHTNHSFRPNSVVRFRSSDSVSLVAVEAILPLEEITIDYHVTESSLHTPFLDATTQQPVTGHQEETN